MTAESLHLRRSPLAGSALAAGLALIVAGCETYTEKTAVRNREVREGSLQLSAVMATKDAEENRDGPDAVLYRLEEGSIHRAAGLAGELFPDELRNSSARSAPMAGEPGSDNGVEPDHLSYFRRSLAAFNEAEEKINAFEAGAVVSAGSIVTSLLTNQESVPYRGRGYDKVMLNTYKALNYLHLGDGEAARVELNRVLQRQRDAVAENARRIEEARQTALEAREGRAMSEDGKATEYDVERARADTVTGAQLAALEAAVDLSLRAYGDYVNPFSVFLDGLFFMTQATGGSDLERARLSIARVAGMVPENPYIGLDLETAEAAAQGRLPSDLTYVIVEAGSAPVRWQTRVEMPLFLVSGQVAYLDAAFPRLIFDWNETPPLLVAGGGQTLETSLLCSMDAVIAADFANEWPSIVTKTLISTAAKAVVSGIIQKQAKDALGADAGALVGFFTIALQSLLNKADTRTWSYLPREFQYARLPTPPDRLLRLRLGDQGAEQSVQIAPGRVNVVYVRFTAADRPLSVSQFVLRP